MMFKIWRKLRVEGVEGIIKGRERVRIKKLRKNVGIVEWRIEVEGEEVGKMRSEVKNDDWIRNGKIWKSMILKRKWVGNILIEGVEGNVKKGGWGKIKCVEERIEGEWGKKIVEKRIRNGLEGEIVKGVFLEKGWKGKKVLVKMRWKLKEIEREGGEGKGRKCKIR